MVVSGSMNISFIYLTNTLLVNFTSKSETDIL